MPDAQLQNIQLKHHSMLAMNSQLDMVIWGIDSKISQRAMQTIEARVVQLEKIISRYDSNSELFQLNRKAFQQPIKMSTQLWDAVSMGVRYFQRTSGYFDIFNGTLYHEWKNGNETATILFEEGTHRVSINEESRTIQFLQPNVTIDFGGMGKGLALYYTDRILSEFQIENAFISFGGSSILTRGRHPHGEYWPFSLAENPERVWKLNNAALSISKTSRKVEQGASTHILNPKSGKVISTVKTVVVQAENPVDAEVLSTTLIVAPDNEHAAILSTFQNIQFQISL